MKNRIIQYTNSYKFYLQYRFLFIFWRFYRYHNKNIVTFRTLEEAHKWLSKSTVFVELKEYNVIEEFD